MNKVVDIILNGERSCSGKISETTIEAVGCLGWELEKITMASVNAVILKASPKAEVFPLHKDANRYYGYVIEGRCQLNLGTATEVKETKVYEKGDSFVFEPNTFHGWKNLDSNLQLLFVTLNS